MKTNEKETRREDGLAEPEGALPKFLMDRIFFIQKLQYFSVHQTVTKYSGIPTINFTV